MSFLSWLGLMTQADKSLLEAHMDAISRQIQTLTENMSQLTEHVLSLQEGQEKSIGTFTATVRNEAIQSTERSGQLLSAIQQEHDFVKQNREDFIREIHYLGNILTEQKQYIEAEMQGATDKIIEETGSLVSRMDVLQENSDMKHMELKHKTTDIFDRQEQMQKELMEQEKQVSKLMEHVLSLRAAQEKSIDTLTEEVRNETIQSTERSERLLFTLQEEHDFVKQNRDELMRGLHILGNMMTEQKKYIGVEMQGVAAKIIEGNESSAAHMNMFQKNSDMRYMDLKHGIDEVFDCQEKLRSEWMVLGTKLYTNTDGLREWIGQLSASHVEKQDLELLSSYLRLLLANQLMDRAEELLAEDGGEIPLLD